VKENGDLTASGAKPSSGTGGSRAASAGPASPALVRLASGEVGPAARFPRLRAAALRPLVAADAALTRLLGWEANPLHQAGAIAALAFLIMLASGVYLLFLYRVGSPYESMQAIQAQAFAGRWLRALHRYAADAAVIAAALHVFRIWAQGRSWGPRALAWLSGLVLLFLLFVSGWTGYVMVWDEPALVLAREGARLLDALPVFAEPLERAFSGERAMPSAFFFLNLFAHVAVPIGMAGLLLVHVARLARPQLLPPRRLALGLTLALTALALAVPAPLPPRAEPLALPRVVPLDLFYAFWLPVTRGLTPLAAWGALAAATLAAASAPWWTRPRRAARAAPSHVDPERCTGCEQCALDCPFDAIEMLERLAAAPSHAGDAHPEKSLRYAHVEPARCVACGICAGSCAPMAVGPPGRTGRDQLAAVRELVAQRPFAPGDVVVVACNNGVGAAGDPALRLAIECAGNLHSSVVELLVRSGAGGVLVAACSPRDCRAREGPKWLGERLFHEREAELQTRVDRARVRVVALGAGERAAFAEALARFREEVGARERAQAEAAVELATECATSAPGPAR
jgi:ferredoxin/coenzyme F420-reducing hydrogenase delta subunit